MKYTGPYCYTLFLSGSRKSRFIKKKLFNKVESDFKSPVTSLKQPKLYILKAKGRVVYIGYTSQSVGSRFYGGLKADGQNGYYGYQWRRYDKLDLVVFCFPPFSKIEKEREREEKFAQAVEAELVFLVRESTGKWPECQNEIHFFNNNKAKKVAASIFNSINLT